MRGDQLRTSSALVISGCRWYGSSGDSVARLSSGGAFLVLCRANRGGYAKHSALGVLQTPKLLFDRGKRAHCACSMSRMGLSY